MEKLKIEALLKDMSLEEKIDQLLQVCGYYFETEGVVTGPANQAGFSQDEVDMAGSVLGIAGADKLKKIQENYMKKQPHHIPLIFMADVINGFKTIFPIPLAQGCTFEPQIAKEGAKIAASESASAGLHLTFSPMVDLVRDPRWGRVMESTGEDTYLNSCFSKAMVEGYQGSEGLSKKGKIAACVKHFAGYGAPIGGRDYNTVELSKRTLLDNYLPAYRAAIDAGCATVMASFNTLDRVPSSANKWLMRDILRKEMGFEGALISDWASIEEIINHGLAADKKGAARLAIEAGVDIDMMTTCYCQNLKTLVEDKIINETLIDESVLRILELKNNLGLFENPYKDADAEEEKQIILCENHRLEARRAVRESLVLLKNDAVLPLKSRNEKIAFIGPHVSSHWIMGVWSIFGNANDTVTLEEGVNNLGIKDVTFSKGCPVLKTTKNLEVNPLVINEIEEDNKNADKLLEEALKNAREAETVVLALGEHPSQSGESCSKTDLHIPQIQIELFEKIYQVNQNIVIVLFNGRPLVIDELFEKSKAVLEVWLPGTEGGNGIAEVLFGKESPSGKLAMSFPRNVGQIPVYYNDFRTGRPADGKEGKYLSNYIDCQNSPFLPFGYGLSYSEFEISKIILSNKVLKKQGMIKAKVTVKNTGKYTAKEVVQLYINDPVASVSRPVRELKGFLKLSLNPMEEMEVVFEITEEMLRFHDINGNFVSEAGEFNVLIGNCSTTSNHASFLLED